MADPWSELLNRLNLTDERVYEFVAQACYAKYRHKATEEFCQAVRSEVFIGLRKRLAADPTNPSFANEVSFRGAVRTAARRARGADIHDRFVRTRPPVSYLPGEVIDQNPGAAENDFDWHRLRELMADCNEACRRCLSDAEDAWREVFRLTCERVRPGEIAARLNLKPLTVWRHLQRAFTVFRRDCGHMVEGGR